LAPKSSRKFTDLYKRWC